MPNPTNTQSGHKRVEINLHITGKVWAKASQCKTRKHNHRPNGTDHQKWKPQLEWLLRVQLNTSSEKWLPCCQQLCLAIWVGWLLCVRYSVLHLQYCGIRKHNIRKIRHKEMCTERIKMTYPSNIYSGSFSRRVLMINVCMKEKCRFGFVEDTLYTTHICATNSREGEFFLFSLTHW